jgi:hypothetical protein
MDKNLSQKFTNAHTSRKKNQFFIFYFKKNGLGDVGSHITNKIEMMGLDYVGRVFWTHSQQFTTSHILCYNQCTLGIVSLPSITNNLPSLPLVVWS